LEIESENEIRKVRWVRRDGDDDGGGGDGGEPLRRQRRKGPS
jgi:hypothetical protein